MSARAFRRGLGRPRDKYQYLAELMPMREALLDPRWCLPALTYLTAAARATDMGGPGPAQCFSCPETWDAAPPAAFLVIETLRPAGQPVLTAGMCAACAHAPDARSRLIATLQQDLRAGPDRIVPITAEGQA